MADRSVHIRTIPHFDIPYHADDIVDLLEEKDQQISDLEAKLAESEKQIKDAREAGNMAVDSWCKNRRKYEAQIAEMQNKSFILYSMLYETLEKQGCDNVASQIDQMTGWTYDKEADWLKGNRNYDQLKKQLEESEKKAYSRGHSQRDIANEIKLNALREDVANKEKRIVELKQQLKEKEKEISEVLAKQSITCLNTIEKAYQDKISFALEQLEKAKSFCISAEDNGWCVTHKNWLEIVEYIDNQIKQLKEKK